MKINPSQTRHSPFKKFLVVAFVITLIALVAFLSFRGGSLWRDTRGMLSLFAPELQQPVSDIQGLEKEYIADQSILFDLRVPDKDLQTSTSKDGLETDLISKMLKINFPIAHFGIRQKGNDKIYPMVPALYGDSDAMWSGSWYQILKAGEYEMIFQSDSMEEVAAFTVVASTNDVRVD